MRKQRKCEARQFSDQKVCDRCNVCWDVNDIDPPKCATGYELFLRKRKELKRDNNR